MIARTKMMIVGVGVVALLSGLLGCGKKEDEEPKVDAATSNKFASPPMKTGAAPGGAGGTGTAAKPDTQ